ncbi:MAG TPA: arylamine N-acetyltransferase [Steroidobacteraceae bacterium]|jgi:N-hydroxyarylamine O-acetyltransferase
MIQTLEASPSAADSAATAAADEIDLDRYFARIGYTGSPRPDLATLRALTELHPAVIPFEAVDVFLGRPVDLSLPALQAKLIRGGCGGYCFEQNGLLQRVLGALGFTVEGLIGRVLWMRPQDAPLMPLTHMALRVTIEGERWLADVGFGSCIAGAPLRFDAAGTEQPTGHETFRLMRRGSWTLLEAQLPDGWFPLYMLSPEPALDSDYLVANWYTSTHPESAFRRELRVARTTPDRRTTLMNNRLTVRYARGGMERRFLGEHEIADALVSTFGLRLHAESAQQAAALATAAAAAPQTAA